MLRALWPEFARRGLPGFALSAEQVSVLASPIEFFALLVRGIRESTYRISLSTLYVGSGEMEAFLLEELLQASNKNPYLRVRVIVDRYRGMRFSGGESSARQLFGLLHRASHPSNLEFVLYRNARVPALCEPLVATGLPEILGTFHAKAYLFDDSVLLTGANLAQEYFLTRKDRYVLIDSARDFANYIDDFSAVFADQGERIRKAKVIERRNVSFAAQQRNVARGTALFLHSNRPAPAEASRLSQLVSNFDEQRALPLQARSAAQPLFDAALLESFRAADNRETVRKAFDRADALIPRPQRPVSAPADDVLLFPTFQNHRTGLRDDEEMLLKLLERCGEPGTRGRFTLASGYFNPSAALLQRFRALSPQMRMEFVAGSPRNSSFYGAGPLRGMVPLVYRVAFHRWVRALGAHPNAHFFEFFREGSTFHAKGVWAQMAGAHVEEHLTLIGSSNYSQRSFARDVEAQFWLFTKHPALVSRLESDRQMLLDHAAPVSLQQLPTLCDPRVGAWGKLLHWMVQGFA